MQDVNQVNEKCHDDQKLKIFYLDEINKICFINTPFYPTFFISTV